MLCFFTALKQKLHFSMCCNNLFSLLGRHELEGVQCLCCSKKNQPFFSWKGFCHAEKHRFWRCQGAWVKINEINVFIFVSVNLYVRFLAKTQNSIIIFATPVSCLLLRLQLVCLFLLQRSLQNFDCFVLHVFVLDKWILRPDTYFFAPAF